MASNLRSSFPAFRFLSYFFLVVTTFVCSPCFLAAATQVTLAWDENSEPDLAGYHLYARQVDQEYNYTSPAWGGSETTCTIYNLVDTVEYCFVVRAYDTGGNESSDSNEVCLPTTPVDSDDIDDDRDGLTENQGDCNDADPGIHTGAEEVCGDGVDQNCDGSDLTCANVIADAGPDQTVIEGDTVILDGSNSYDPEGRIVFYLWTQTSGIEANLSGADPSTLYFTAPEVVSDATILEFSLTVEDSDGLTSTDTCVVTVKKKNQPPVADAGPDQKVAINTEVSLIGSNSTSSDDSTLSYSWMQTSGETVQLSDTLAPSPTFQASVAEQALVFDLTVTDAKGFTNTDSCIVNVSEQNEPPTSFAGSDTEVTSNQIVRLDGAGSMDDGEFVSYSWLQTEGPTVALSDPISSTPEFTSPPVGPEGASLTFQLTVTDQGGLKDTDSCIVNVTSQNQPPEAVTKEYLDTAPDMAFTLDGTLSTDIDDGIENYRWHQLEGPPVTFDNPKAAQVKFFVPAVGPYGSNMLFALKVKDKSGLKKSAKCAVFVQPKNSETSPFTVTPSLNLFQKGPFYQSKASVIVVEKSTGAVVKDVKVKGQWSLHGVNPESGNTVIGYTNGAGEAKFVSERFVDKGTIKFTVIEVSKDGNPYTVNIESRSCPTTPSLWNMDWGKGSAIKRLKKYRQHIKKIINRRH